MKAIRARFVRIFARYVVPLSQSALRLISGLGMALIVSGMLRYPFDGSCSGYSWRLARLIITLSAATRCFWHLPLITLLLRYQLSFNKIK
jgi:hypothetical protein